MNSEKSGGRKSLTRAWYSLAAAAAAVLMMVSSASSKSAKPKPEALWVVNDSGNSVSEFANGTLETSGTPTPDRINTSANLNEPWGIVFDSSKNLWVSNIGNGTLTKFTLAQLKALNMNQAPAATVVISGLDRPEGIVFDKHHNLWVANEGNGELLEFTSRQLKSSGSPVPNITLNSSDLSSPVGIAFDKKGDIWVGDDDLNHVTMFTAAQLKAGGTQSATVILSSDGSGSLDEPEPVAFDAQGSLWVANNDDLVQGSR
jgi:sugar lactone lactonase YvrE